MMIVMVKASSKFLGSISGGAIDENCRTANFDLQATKVHTLKRVKAFASYVYDT